jgi:hypothetical protein
MRVSKKTNQIKSIHKTNLFFSKPLGNFHFIRDLTYFSKFSPGDIVTCRNSGLSGVVGDVIISKKPENEHSVHFFQKDISKADKLKQTIVSEYDLYKNENQVIDNDTPHPKIKLSMMTYPTEFETKFNIGDVLTNRFIPNFTGKVDFILYKNKTVYYGLKIFGQIDGAPRESQIFWEEWLQKED